MEPNDTSTERERVADEQPALPQSDVPSPEDGPPAFPDRYAALDLAREETIIYDQSTPSAWIQSSVAQSLDRSA